MLSSNAGTRECSCSRSSGRISWGGVATSRQNMSGRGTITSRTRVSSSSNTLWIISRSVRSTTPSRAPTSTSARSSSSETSGWPTCRSDPTRRRVTAVNALSPTRIGFSRTESHATGRFTQAANRSGCSTARVMGSTSPNTVSRNTMPPIAMARPFPPKTCAAMAAARAEAPMFTTVMPTRRVTSSSWGCASSGASGPGVLPCCSASSFSRVRPSEKYAASAPESSAEARSRTPRRISSGRTRLSMEMLEAAAHRHRRAGCVHEDGLARGPLDPSDHGERGAGGLGEARAEVVGFGGVARQQELVVLPAAHRPLPRVGPERAGRLPRRRPDRDALEPHAGAHPALPADVPEIRGEAVGAIHHGVDAGRLTQPAPLRDARAGPEVDPRDLAEPRGGQARVTGAVEPDLERVDAAHGRDVGEVDRERLPADIGGGGGGPAEVDVLDQQIGGGEQLVAGWHREDRGVVADADLHPGRGGARGGAPPDATDQLALAQPAQAHPFGWLRVHAGAGTGVSARKLASSALPWLVRMDSGWNCTPSTG